MSVNVRFWDRLARRYARMQVRDPEAYDRKLAMTRAHFPPDARVFEFGCGTGTTALKHAPHVGHVTAIDCSANMIGIAREKAAAEGIGNATFKVASLEDMPEAPGAWDMVMAHNVLHLLPDRQGALARVNRMLKPGGAFVSSTACAARAPWLFRAILKTGHALRLLPLFNFLTEAQLKAEIEAAGFEIAEEWLPPGGRSALFLIARKKNELPRGPS
ncbi:class I SAM-dependent methyltransferase [Rhodovulum euryhalinum]|uniref:Ubiquinone/menaquinone biosynthesis C-methylase UbiE n=1 Tax=Rhodovulum euryhalinum TaxID=35805 RepID=A0A4R2KHZ8_9RHOB|nr:class I SAM-dependent methyltransferase [Rhodovulum euryhalinum]TCO73471.1 ubiquinone/menaquinone biosynthesis C-methylase UbiE [Rhodovulum euryhalinum]